MARHTLGRHQSINFVSLAAGVTCPFMQGYTAMAGYDHSGDDITQMAGATLQDLVTACNASPTCYAFNWSPYSYKSSGYLKTAATASVSLAGMCFYRWTSKKGFMTRF